MTRRHHDYLVRAFPEKENAIYLTMLYPRGLDVAAAAGAEVPDPIGESVAFYLDVLKMLEPALPRIMGAALGEENP
jgi:protein-tyrosine-phosphatase